MCLKTVLVVLFIIYIGNYSSAAQQQHCQKIQINNSKMYGECCVFKVENINLQDEVEEALLKSSLIRESQAKNDFTNHNPKLPQYHGINRPPPGAKQNQQSSNNKHIEDLQPMESSLLPNIREKPNNQFDNPIMMKFPSNNRGRENQYPKENIEPHSPENLQSGGNRETFHRDVPRPTHQDIRPFEESHRHSTPPSLPVDQHERDFLPYSHRKTPIIENSMAKNTRVRPQDTPVISHKKDPQDNARIVDYVPPRRQDDTEMADNYSPRNQGNLEPTRLPEDFPERRPQDNPSFENLHPIEEPFTRPNVQRPTSPALQRNSQKSNMKAEKKVSVSTSDTYQSTIKPLIKSTTEDDSSDIVFLPDEQSTEVPKVVENTTITSNVSGVDLDNRNAVGVPNERVLPNGDQATEF
ncbi:unnamed protein product [Ceutorhynchus assimilis]|uniref:Uncharacterized protein n=1 Tax=Ceutorhynchus assimilis TaxID=467358 RepID=A0A9P0DGN8_9CUCU|nr:unnamed protein product [Ceutorhynchus assimilis]